MQIVSVIKTGNDYIYRWPSGDEVTYPDWIKYLARSDDGDHEIIVAFGTRPVYGRDRVRIVIFIDYYATAEFFGADDIEFSGEVLSDIKVRGEVGERICRYPEEPVPERYGMFRIVGLPNRVNAKGVHNAWAVVADISDHQSMITLAALRREERER